ncbi:MAG: hypothetical protein CMP10_19200 [Zetaproteobacteria bacterium]|nr:hypothetical protein [Pseudobdellovibrionaceae bacterium]
MDISLAKMRKNLDLYSFQDYILYFKAIYKVMKESKRSYTLVDYSEDLGFGRNNTMAQMHSGHRSLSQKAVERIGTLLKLDKAEKAYLQTLVDIKSAKSSAYREEKMALLLELQGRASTNEAEGTPLSFFNSWHHAVIFELLSLDVAQSVPQLQQKFSMNISEKEILKSIKLLQELDLISLIEEGENIGYIKNQKDFSLGGAIPGTAIVRFHQEMMNLAKESLISTPPQQRDISSVTISVNEKTLARMKKDVEIFRKYLLFQASLCEQEDVVMQVNIQLFPLSK